MKRFSYFAVVPISVVVLAAVRVLAVPTPEASLNTCQDKVRTEGKKFVQNTVTAVSNCLKKVAIDSIKSNVAITAATSKACVNEFRKINDTRVIDKSIEEKFKQNVDKKCEPGFSASQTHALNDITAHLGGGVLEKIKSVNSDTWCKHFGGDGSIDSVPEWENCLVASFNCQAAAAIASQYPRSAEWLTTLIAPLSNMNLVASPTGDPSKTTDAVSGASDMRDLIDPDGDGIPSPRCGGEGAACVTGCCYVENPPTGAPSPADANCFEWTAPAAAAGAFLGACVGPGVAGFQIKTALPGPCGISPLFGTPCLGPPNKVIIPTESSCP